MNSSLINFYKMRFMEIPLFTDNGFEVLGILVMVNSRELELEGTQYVLGDLLHCRLCCDSNSIWMSNPRILIGVLEDPSSHKLVRLANLL